MSATLPFDTLAYSQKLKNGGVPSAQAETHADALGRTLEQLDHHIATKKDIDTVVAKVEHAETSLRRDIKDAKREMVIILGLMLTGGLTILGTLMKLL